MTVENAEQCDHRMATVGDRGRSIKKRRNRNGTQEMKAKEIKKQETVGDVVPTHLIQSLSHDKQKIEPGGSANRGNALGLGKLIPTVADPRR